MATGTVMGMVSIMATMGTPAVMGMTIGMVMGTVSIMATMGMVNHVVTATSSHRGGHRHGHGDGHWLGHEDGFHYGHHGSGQWCGHGHQQSRGWPLAWSWGQFPSWPPWEWSTMWSWPPAVTGMATGMVMGMGSIMATMGTVNHVVMATSSHGDDR